MSEETQPTTMQGIFLTILAKHGPWAGIAALAVAAFYSFTLQPMAEDRRILLDTLQSNLLFTQEILRRVETNTIKLNDADLSRERLFGEFIDGVKSCHEQQDKALDEILERLKSNPSN